MNMTILKWSMIAVLSAALLGCGGGGGGQTSSPSPTPVPTPVPTTATVSGTVTGLNGNSVVLQNNGGNDVTVGSKSPTFDFGSLASGSPYAVTVKTHPSFPAANCTVTGGSGTVAATNITVQVSCTDLAVPELTADVYVSHARTVTLNWSAFAPHPQRFNVYVFQERDCPFTNNVPTCANEKLSDVRPGVQVSQFNGPLRNGEAYYFRLESEYDNGAKGLANQDGARPNELAFGTSINNGAQAVSAIAIAPNGTTYIGGFFSTVGVATGGAVPLDLRTGRFTAADFPAIAGTVNAIIADGAGGWFIGGLFTHAGSELRRNLAHIGADGSVDPDFQQFPDGQVLALERVGSTLFVGGNFHGICLPDGSFCADRDNAAAISTTGTVLDWTPQPSAPVHAFKAVGDVLFMGGDFNVPAFLAAFRLNTDGSGSPLSSDPTSFDMHLDNPVRALAAHGTALYVGGDFSQFGGARRLKAARVDLDGGVANLSTSFAPDPSDNMNPGFVSAIDVSPDGGTVYLGGRFSSINAVGGPARRTNLAAVSADLGFATSWVPQPNDTVRSLAVSAQGTVYVGGDFSAISGVPRFQLAALEPSDAAPALPQFHPDPRAPVRALAVAGSTLYAGGYFNSLRGTERLNLAALDAAGSLLDWAPPTSGAVEALAVRDSGSTVYVGGTFATIGGKQKANLAALDGISGIVDDSFFGTANGTVTALAVLEGANAALYVGGRFGTSGSVTNRPVTNLAKLSLADGTLQPNFLSEPNGEVFALVATHDTALDLDVVYVGGDFNHVNGSQHPNLAKLNAVNAVPLPWTQFPNAAVRTLALSRSDGGRVLYAGGDFNAPNPGGFAALDADGTRLLNEFAPGTLSGGPLSLAIFPGEGGADTVFAGGDFRNLGGGPVFNFVDLTGFRGLGVPAGQTSGTFAMPNGPVFAVAVFGSKVYIGGVFSGLHGAINGSNGPAVRGNFAVIDAGELL
jgi:trimeric autotransporter adhesin